MGLLEMAGESHVENAFEMVCLPFLLKACVIRMGVTNCPDTYCSTTVTALPVGICVCLYGCLALLFEMLVLGCVHIQTSRQIPFGLQSVENWIVKQCLRGNAEGGHSLFSPIGMLFKSWKNAVDFSLS